MKFLEKNLEDIICESDRTELSKRGLYIDGLLFRQLRIGNYGVADIVTLKRDTKESLLSQEIIETEPIITVYELKKDAVGIDSFMQAVRYLKGIQRYLSKRNLFDDAKYRIVLIGSYIDESTSLIYLNDILPLYEDTSFFFSMLEYEYKIDGIYFNNKSDYKLTDEGF